MVARPLFHSTIRNQHVRRCDCVYALHSPRAAELPALCCWHDAISQEQWFERVREARQKQHDYGKDKGSQRLSWERQCTLTSPLLAVMRRSYIRTQVSEPPTANRWGLDDGESMEFRSTAVRMRRPRERSMDESALLLMTPTNVQGCNGSRLSICLTAHTVDCEST